MKDLLARIQKDFKNLQETIEKEGNELLAKAKKAANDIAKNNNVKQRTKEIEKLIETKFKKFEPAISDFLTSVQKNAEKYGLDVNSLEKAVKKGVTQAKSSLSSLKKKGTAKKSTAKAATAKPKKKAPAKKKAATKKSKTSQASGSAS